jgi:hypothetical protein
MVRTISFGQSRCAVGEQRRPVFRVRIRVIMKELVNATRARLMRFSLSRLSVLDHLNTPPNGVLRLFLRQRI